jgi:hypothetical protein
MVKVVTMTMTTGADARRADGTEIPRAIPKRRGAAGRIATTIAAGVPVTEITMTTVVTVAVDRAGIGTIRAAL